MLHFGELVAQSAQPLWLWRASPADFDLCERRSRLVRRSSRRPTARTFAWPASRSESSSLTRRFQRRDGRNIPSTPAFAHCAGGTAVAAPADIDDWLYAAYALFALTALAPFTHNSATLRRPALSRHLARRAIACLCLVSPPRQRVPLPPRVRADRRGPCSTRYSGARMQNRHLLLVVTACAISLCRCQFFFACLRALGCWCR